MSTTSLSRMIQVRNVPAAVHRELVRRAKKRGETLTQYVEEILAREVATKTIEEVYEDVLRAGRVELPTAPAELLRHDREERDTELEERTQRVLIKGRKRRETA